MSMNGRIKRPQTDDRLILPRIGSIKVGKKSEKGYPQSVDYFIASGKYASLFEKAYGEKPQTIQIVFPDDDPCKVCNEHYEYRDDNGALIASGDGETFKIWTGSEYRELTTEKYPNLMDGVAKRYPNKRTQRGLDGWEVTLTMNFIIPLVRGVAGLWTFTTKGEASTIPQIRQTYDGILEQKGRCKGIIFDLNVKFATSQKPNGKSRYPVVTLVPNESEENVEKVTKAYEPIRQIK